MTRLPVTLLTGFLGAGKTTLINQLLQRPDSPNIAIIENEFGEVNIDRQLLPEAQVNIVSLSQGCVCCSLRGELTQALIALLAQFDKDNISCDHLILETTGLADPAPIIQTFFIDEMLSTRLTLDGVVTLVDCTNIEQQLAEHRVVHSQIGFADRLLLSKAEHILPEKIPTMIQRLQAINPSADLFFVENGQIDPKHWLHIGAFHLNEKLPFGQSTPPDSESIALAPHRLIPMPLSHPLKTLPTSHHDKVITSFVLRGGQVDLAKLDTWLTSLITEHGNDMLRYKGIIAIAGESRKLILQGVHKVVSFDYGADWPPNTLKETVIVIISRPLPREEIQSQFEQVLIR